jgi:hypothetical protein
MSADQWIGRPQYHLTLIHETKRDGYHPACRPLNRIIYEPLLYHSYSIPFVDNTLPANRSSNIVA